MKYFFCKRQHLRQNFLFGFLAVGLFLALPVLTLGAPGDLDTTFGNGGIVITTGSTINHLSTALGMAIQPDGKIVVVGDGATGNTFWDFAVVRYNTDGSLDSSFGGTGIVITPVGNSHAQAASVAIQADGKIVVAGGAGTGFAVVRYNTNGSLDTSFGGTGKVITSASSGARDLAIQTDGKIVVAGENALIRYNTNGSPDTSFNGTGLVIIQGGSAGSVAIQSDGKIVAAGESQNSFAVYRYNPDGSPETSFGGTGKVITPVGNSSDANDLTIQSDGKIVVVGGSPPCLNNKFTLVRYNADGSLDTSLNGTGIVVTPVGSFCSRANSVAIQADGKIVASGNSSSEIGTFGEFTVVRYSGNGSLDTTFGGTGIVVTPVTIRDSDASSVAIQADGKIVAAGSGGYDWYDFAVVRYQGDSNANIRTRFDFDGDRRADISVFRPSDKTWYLNRSTDGFAAAQFGLSTDKITPADFDGDGKTDISVFRDGFWYWIGSSNNQFNAVQFGISSDIPVPADFTGDGRSELAVYRGGNWYTLNLATNQFNALRFGISTDKPVIGDYDGDSRADFAVYRDGIWYLLQSTNGFAAIQFGLSTDKTVPADYDGDGETDVAVYRDGVWYLQQSNQGFTAFQFGISTDIPAPADYNGDGRADAAVYRDGNWYLRQSANGFAAVQFGSAADKPVPSAYAP